MTPRNIVGLQLRKFRIERGMSQRELAVFLQCRGWDVSRGAIARIEGQVRWVADFELLFLSQALEKPVEEFFDPAQSNDLAEKLVRDLQWGMA